MSDLPAAVRAFRDAFMREGDAHSPEQWAAAERLDKALKAEGQPSTGAREQATRILDEVEIGAIGPHTHELLHGLIATALQDNFDLGHKSAGGGQMDRAPCMGGFLEIALDQAEIDALGEVADVALDALIEPKVAEALTRFLEKISLFRRSKQ